MKNKFSLNLAAKFAKAKSQLPQAVGSSAVNAFKESFRQQRFYSDNSDPWKRRKDKKDPGRAILVKTGRLRRSIRLRQASFEKILILSDVKYAAIHNEGLGKMPKRKFMGNSTRLNKRINKVIQRFIREALAA